MCQALPCSGPLHASLSLISLTLNTLGESRRPGSLVDRKPPTDFLTQLASPQLSFSPWATILTIVAILVQVPQGCQGAAKSAKLILASEGEGGCGLYARWALQVDVDPAHLLRSPISCPLHEQGCPYQQVI